jgi:glycosyltransferase involved in cell wall biosynthesis
MKNKPIEVHLVHDWLTGMRGGEKVLELLCRRFPEAPLHTLLSIPENVSQTISSHPIHTSLLQYLPLAKTKYRYYLPVFPLLAEMEKIRSGDLVISSSHAVAKAMVKKNKILAPFHICYIHTPMRYVWDRFDDYFGKQKFGFFISRFFFFPLAKLIQAYDYFTSRRVDVFVANSNFVAQRVKRFYKREAEVLAPPVDLQLFKKTKRSPEDWFLIVTALVPYKKTELAIQACQELGQKLKIIGKGPEEKKLKLLAKKLGADVQFLGFISDTELASYYSRAKALLFPGVEDFGIVPVEAIATGCPVIAYKEGGILDSMTDDTAVFYNEPTASGLKEAMKKFETKKFDESTLRKRAEIFSQEQFMLRFETILKKYRSDLFS